MGRWHEGHQRSSDRQLRRLGTVHVVPLVVLVLLLGATAAVTVFSHAVVANQERKLLNERANEVNLVLNTSISAVSTNLGLLSQGYRDGGTKGFSDDAAAQIAAATTGSSPPPRTLAVLQPSGGGFVVLASAGRGLAPGQTVAGAPVAAMRAAAASSKMAATGIYLAAGTRAVGFALRGPGGVVVFEQSLLGPVQPPTQAASRPFSELRVVLYASSRPDPAQAVVATTKKLPLHGSVVRLPLMVGSTEWLTAVNAVHPLVGSVASEAPWSALIVGVVGSLLVFLLFENMARRRDAAVEALETEHRFAESLQRRLLPAVPALRGLDIASSYVPGADHQQVGGDWFDVFELPSGQAAVVIGDVMGHDVEAAAIMAQVRASLRSYAAVGGDPASTIEQLAGFIDLFAIPAIVTVVFGLLDPPADDGSRRFTWANAGHLPPLLRLPDGTVAELGEGASPLLGAPVTLSRPAATRTLPAGATVLFYTDGLVETQGRSLGVTIDQLKGTLRHTDRLDAEGVCTAVLSTQLPSSRRDDVALLVVKVEAAGAERSRGAAPTAATTRSQA